MMRLIGPIGLIRLRPIGLIRLIRLIGPIGLIRQIRPIEVVVLLVCLEVVFHFGKVFVCLFYFFA